MATRIVNALNVPLKAPEQGTVPLDCTVRDEDGVLVVPNANTLKWTLVDINKNVVNSREDVAVTSASTFTIVLSGNDLACGTSSGLVGLRRFLLIKAEYDSDLGDDLPLRDEFEFEIDNHVALGTG